MRTSSGFLLLFALLALSAICPSASLGAAISDYPTPYSPSTGHLPVAGTRDVCFSRPPNLYGGKISSDIIGAYGLVSEIADDFMICDAGIAATIVKAIGYGGYYNWAPGDPDVTAYNLRWFDDTDCFPGAMFASQLGLTETVSFIGYDGFGYPTYKLEFVVSVAVDGATRYWWVLQADDHVFPPQWGRQQAADFIWGCDAMFKSAFFGYPDWVPAGGLDIFFDAAQEFDCECGPTSSQAPTWGQVKALFR